MTIFTGGRSDIRGTQTPDFEHIKLQTDLVAVYDRILENLQESSGGAIKPRVE